MSTLPATALSPDACPHLKGRPANTHWSQPRNPGLRLTDDEIVKEVEDWMASRLPCVAGRREYNRGRYLIRAARRASVNRIFSEYRAALRANRAVACLFVFNNPDYAEPNADVAETFAYLAEQMQPLSALPARDLATGAPLTNSIELVCPVTGVLTQFDDFECIAFCPQSNDVHDPLYDPLLAMPYPCVNMSSDVYAFSRFVADGLERALGVPAYLSDDLDRLEELLETCVARWQRVATATIDKYESLTDTGLCPVHVTADSRHWIAGHKDPAFAEVVKETHKHELPVLYATRIVKNWMQYFRGGDAYQATGLAREGEPAPNSANVA